MPNAFFIFIFMLSERVSKIVSKTRFQKLVTKNTLIKNEFKREVDPHFSQFPQKDQNQIFVGLRQVVKSWTLTFQTPGELQESIHMENISTLI